MKFCAIQSPYPYTLEQADAAVDFAVQTLKQCDPSIDLILLPEYSNAPTVFPEGECIPYAEKHTKLLIDTAVETARRCNAIVAVNYAANIGGRYRNTTRVFDRRGKIAGDYYKQHLPHSEVHVKKMDDSYTFDYLPPAIVETDGLRFAFLTCYDCYFEEYIAHIAARKPDVVLVSSHQRAERPDIIEMLVKSLAFHANAFVLRASVSMGVGRQDGGCSMIASPDGKILARFGQETGLLTCEVGDPRRKYMRSNCFGGKLIRNDQYIGQGRTPWSYRAGGSMVKPNDEQMRYPRICAHRGFNTVAPENSLPAFGAAIALGAQEIELDVWMTKDGVPVVAHDEAVDRVSDGHGKITEMTFDELRRLDFGAHYAEAFTGLRIPSFEEVLKAFSRQTVINLHIKSSGDEYFSRDTVRRIASLLHRYDFAEHAYFTARKDVMEAALEVAPEIRRCMSGYEPDRIVENAIHWKCAKLQFMKGHCTQAMIDKAHANGIRCNFFWSDDPAEARQLLDMGIDTILTNDYLRVSGVLK